MESTDVRVSRLKGPKPRVRQDNSQPSGFHRCLYDVMQIFQISDMFGMIVSNKRDDHLSKELPVNGVTGGCISVLRRFSGHKWTLAVGRAFTCCRRLISSRTAGVVDDLSLNNPLPLIIPSGAMAMMTTIALPVVANFALVLDLSDAVLSPGSDAVRYLD